MDEDRAVELYVEWRRLRHAPSERPLPAERVKLAGGADFLMGDGLSVTAQQTLDDLLNFVNLFILDFRRLRSLVCVLDGLEEHEQYEAILEFGYPLVYSGLNAPAAIKGRLHYAIAQVSNLANRELIPDWPNYGALEHSSPELARYMGQFWSGWPALRQALGVINNRAYLGSTQSFRNHYQHGAPVNVGMGARRKIIRDLNGVEIYTIEPPLPLGSVVNALLPQTAAAINAYSQLACLFGEQCAMANKRIQPTP